MKKYFFKYFFILLLVGICFLRFYKIADAPATLIVDEAHYGYLAYSIAETGKDEHGIAWPIVFKGFGDYKLPMQVYLTAPLVKFFGLNNLTPRLVSAISGCVLIMVIYLLFLQWGFSRRSAAFAGLLTATAPWTFMISRLAFEANIGLLFFATGLLFVFKARCTKHLLFLLLAAVFFAGAVHSYVIYKLLSILTVGFFAVYLLHQKRALFSYRKQLLFISLFIFLISPTLMRMGADSNFARFKQVGILSDEQIVLGIDQNRYFCSTSYPQTLCHALYNKPLAYLQRLTQTFITFYSPQYLFVDGDKDLSYMNVDDTGLFYLWTLPFYVLGFLILFRKLSDRNEKKHLLFLAFIIFGLIFSPIPAVLSGVQKVRASAAFLFILPLFVLAYEALLVRVRHQLLNNLLQILLIVLLSLSFLQHYLNFTGVHVAKRDFSYDSFVADIFIFMRDYENNSDFDEVIIQNFFSDPIMYYAFYHRLDPQFYQDQVILSEPEQSGFQHAIQLGKYRVAQSEEPHSLACLAAATNKQVIYIDNQIPKHADEYVLKKIKSFSGALNYAFIIDLSAYGKYLESEQKCQ